MEIGDVNKSLGPHKRSQKWMREMHKNQRWSQVQSTVNSKNIQDLWVVIPSSTGVGLGWDPRYPMVSPFPIPTHGPNLKGKGHSSTGQGSIASTELGEGLPWKARHVTTTQALRRYQVLCKMCHLNIVNTYFYSKYKIDMQICKCIISLCIISVWVYVHAYAVIYRWLHVLNHVLYVFTVRIYI